MKTTIEKDRPVLFLRGFSIGLKKAAKVAAAEREISMKELIEQAVAEFLRNHKK